MQLVIAETSPINYLILIGHIDILPVLFQKVILPAVIRDELSHKKAPQDNHTAGYASGGFNRNLDSVVCGIYRLLTVIV